MTLDMPQKGAARAHFSELCVFKVRDGKIVLHKDYFNYATWTDATGISLDMEKGT